MSQAVKYQIAWTVDMTFFMFAILRWRQCKEQKTKQAAQHSLRQGEMLPVLQQIN
jgi:preprotein translocase subunit YajC